MIVVGLPWAKGVVLSVEIVVGDVWLTIQPPGTLPLVVGWLESGF